MLLACTPAIAMADMVGIDVSGWQAWNVTCTASYDFAVVKVSQGVGFENSSWRTQAKCVTDRGKSLGLYHYAGGNNAASEADYFVGRARDFVGRAVLVLDWESYQNAQWGQRRLGSPVRPARPHRSPAYGRWCTCRPARWARYPATCAPTAACGSPSTPATRPPATRADRGTTRSTARPCASTPPTAGSTATTGRSTSTTSEATQSQWRAYANPAGAAKPATPPQTEKPPTQTVDLQALATATIRGDYGNGQQRRDALGANYDKVMAIVNQRLAGTATVAPQQTTQANTTRVTVRSGDTMSGIASRTGLWPLSRWSVPSGNLNLIYPGQVVTYNGGGSVATGSNAPPSRTVTVRAGDTLSGIAARLGISYTQLTGYRSGNPNVIYPGEVLRY